MAKKSSNNNGNRQNQDPESQKLLSRLESDLQKIETEEIMKGLTKEELEDRGILGDKEIGIERKVFTETTEKEKLSIKPGIEYRRLGDSMTFEEIDADSLMLIKDTLPGKVIATRELDETILFHGGNNVKKEVTESGERYIAKIKGKVVIIRDALHLFPSDIDCELEIRIAEDQMTVNMDCTAEHGDGKALTEELVYEALTQKGVVEGVKIDVIKGAIEDARKLSVPQKDIVIAEGTPPIAGKNSDIDYNFDIEGEKHTFRILPGGKVDYKGSANIVTAKTDELLATIGDPDPGTNGVTVFGELIEAEEGKTTSLVAGNGVRASEDEKSFYAEINGCIVLNYPIIQVLELYEVKGDVDYSTGNIDFSGNVIINGTVREGFEVKADGDIIIQNHVESAKVIAGRDVRISGGVFGQGKGLISAGRDVYVEYTQNGRIEAQGTVYINDFAVNSYIFCNFLNNLKKHGSVVGGEIYAQRGIDVLTLGSPSGTKTYVAAGIDYLVKRKIKEVEESMQFYTNTLEKIDRTLKPILAKIKNESKEANINSGILKKTVAKRKEIVTSLDVMKGKRSQLLAQLEVEGICFVKVKQTCFGDVFLTIKGLKHTTTAKRENVRFYEDQKDGDIKTGAY